MIQPRSRSGPIVKPSSNLVDELERVVCVSRGDEETTFELMTCPPQLLELISKFFIYLKIVICNAENMSNSSSDMHIIYLSQFVVL